MASSGNIVPIPQAGRPPLTGPPSSMPAASFGAAFLGGRGILSTMPEKLSPPNPPLTDGVVALRPFRAEDAPDITAACQDPEIQRWIPIIPVPYAEADARRFILMTLQAWHDGTGYEFAIADAATDRYLGSVGLHLGPNPRRHAIGYLVRARGPRPRHRDQGRPSRDSLGLRTAGDRAPRAVDAAGQRGLAGRGREGGLPLRRADPQLGSRPRRPAGGRGHVLDDARGSGRSRRPLPPSRPRRSTAGPVRGPRPARAARRRARGRRRSSRSPRSRTWRPGRCGASRWRTWTCWWPGRRTGSSSPTTAARTCRRRSRIGELAGCVVACPLHEGRFDLCTGETVQMPTTGGLDADGNYHAPVVAVGRRAEAGAARRRSSRRAG